jgi:hypothetical protein
MSGLATRLRTLRALGSSNLLRVASYRLALRAGIHQAQRISASIPVGAFFERAANPIAGLRPADAWRNDALLFGAHPVPIGQEAPDWLSHPLGTDAPGQPSDRLSPWWRIPDFAGGDIKWIWELSRFDWALAFAQQARAGDTAALQRLNRWIEDWARSNPPYRGANWKCAQEASIRLLHLALAALLLGDEASMSAPLEALVRAHVRRIQPTLSYARAQDNNHATSEAGALFVAGAWLKQCGRPDGAALARRGADLLKRHVRRLFAPDGSFSQYSVNYHRLALDTLSVTELWRRRSGLPDFGPIFADRAASATRWLRAMVDPVSGDVPNVGANDGANLLPLGAAYRDYRPSVQLAAALFCGGRAYAAGPWDDALAWLGVEPGMPLPPLGALDVFDDGGFAVLRSQGRMALLRYPRFRFRPSQADAMHVDYWVDGENLLRDGGTYSYNGGADLNEYFGGVKSHNTVQFDDQPQMPRLSRFLLGDWLATDTSECMGGEDEPGFRASYRHRSGWVHLREIRLGQSLRVIDTVAGFSRKAVLRWRLAPGAWRIEGTSVTDGRDRLSFTGNASALHITLGSGEESRHYFERTSLPVVEVVVTEPATIVSEYRSGQ